jgi:hypothetical protein
MGSGSSKFHSSLSETFPTLVIDLRAPRSFWLGFKLGLFRRPVMLGFSIGWLCATILTSYLFLYVF